MKLNIVIVYGGVSLEHEVSIITAMQILKNLDYSRYNAIPIYISKDYTMFTSNKYSNIKLYRDLDHVKRVGNVCGFIKEKDGCYLKINRILDNKVQIDLAVLALHGSNGEDGVMQGYFQALNVPYTCSSVLSSSLIQDKTLMKQVLRFHKVSTLDYSILDVNTVDYSGIEELGYPIIIKPSTLGSSIGISIINTPNELPNKLTTALTYDNYILAEHYYKDVREFNIAVIKDKKDYIYSNIEEVIKSDSILSYKDKYLNSNNKCSDKRIMPAKLSKANRDKVLEIAKKCTSIFRISGIIRIDFMLINNKFYVNEINSIPGSLATYLFDYSPKAIIDKLINTSIYEYKVREQLNRDYKTNILSGLNNFSIKK